MIELKTVRYCIKCIFSILCNKDGVYIDKKKQVFEGFRFVKSTSLEQIAEAILACSGRLASFTENIFTSSEFGSWTKKRVYRVRVKLWKHVVNLWSNHQGTQVEMPVLRHLPVSAVAARTPLPWPRDPIWDKERPIPGLPGGT